jgi:adenine-specific DNA-methyltransferase
MTKRLQPGNSTTPSEQTLAALALALGARDVKGWSAAEDELAAGCGVASSLLVGQVRRRIRAGDDPLGESLCTIRKPLVRRSLGATYTPPAIVAAMLGWAADRATPARVVDPGAGSARFAVGAGRKFPGAQLLAIEADPLPAILARAHLATAGLAGRAEVRVGDYRSALVPAIDGKTLYLGNPPYVRHHLLGPEWKRWLTEEAKTLGHQASQLAGLHVHFLLATALKAAPGDFGVFITAAEWLDVNYGRLVRSLLLNELGGREVVIIEPTAQPFADSASTAAIMLFDVGRPPSSILLRRVDSVAQLDKGPGLTVPREILQAETRWSRLTRPGRLVPTGYVELGELCRVHRGQVTGSNKVWIAGPHAAGLPDSVLIPAVTRARELIRAGQILGDTTGLRRVIDLPVNLDGFDNNDRRAIDGFLKNIENEGAARTYIAAHRRAWWSVGLREPAPILATYMARRPPAFVLNNAGARHLNIAHGLYPRDPLPQSSMINLAHHLANAVCRNEGRTYAGGLTKFEPREMERLLVPGPSLLARPPRNDNQLLNSGEA